LTRLMLVDDEPNILSSLRRCIHAVPAERFGPNLVIETFLAPAQALARAQEEAFDLVVSDYRMPHMDGVTFLTKMIEFQPNVARIILSGYADLHALIDAINRVQIFRFIAKPWDDQELATCIAQALTQRRLVMENQRLADLIRVQEGKLTRQQMELKRLEELHPGLTKINFGADGSINLDLDGEEFT